VAQQAPILAAEPDSSLIEMPEVEQQQEPEQEVTMADIAVSQEEITVAPTVQSRPFGPPKLPFAGRHMQSAGGWGQSDDQSGFNGNDFSSAYTGY